MRFKHSMLKQEITYPALDITFKTWSEDNEPYIDYPYITKAKYFEVFYFNHEFIDKLGYVFIAKSVMKRDFWQRVNPFACSYQLVFEYTGKKLTIQELQALFIEHRKSNTFLSKFEDLILSAKTFKDILG